MTNPWTVRAARAEDARIIANHRYYRNEPQEDIDAHATRLPVRIERGTYIGFVAEAAGRVVGGAVRQGPHAGSADNLNRDNH